MRRCWTKEETGSPGGAVDIPRKRRNKPATAEPTRFHGPAASVPVAERAQARTAAKNLYTAGMRDHKFTVLHDLPDEHLVSVLHDFGLAFSVETGLWSEAEILSLVRAKEEAQASLAPAAFRKELTASRAAAAVTAATPCDRDGWGHPTVVLGRHSGYPSAQYKG